MNNPILIIYDNTGRIWGMYAGITEVPDGLQGIIADEPEEYTAVSIDMDSDPHKVVWYNDVPEDTTEDAPEDPEA